ncbi:hypothetical protein ACLOAV_010366 [Pseudogymnoascus australis]
MADEASNQRHKQCHADESSDQLASSRDQGMSPKLAEVVETLVEALNKRKRQRLNKVGSLKPPGWYAALAEEIDAKPSDPVATDKSDIEQELGQGPPFWYCSYPKPVREEGEMRSGEEGNHVDHADPARRPASEIVEALKLTRRYTSPRTHTSSRRYTSSEHIPLPEDMLLPEDVPV